MQSNIGGQPYQYQRGNDNSGIGQTNPNSSFLNTSELYGNNSQLPLNQQQFSSILESEELPENYNQRQRKPGDQGSLMQFNPYRRNLRNPRSNNMMVTSNLDHPQLPNTYNQPNTYNTQPQLMPMPNQTSNQNVLGGLSGANKSGTNDSPMDISPAPRLQNNRRNNAMQGKPISTVNEQQNGPINPNMNGFMKLAQLSRIFVKQKFEMLEMLTGCETENRYKVYAADQGLERVGRPIFKCKEKSGFFARNLLSGDCRPFGMRIIHEDREEDDDSDDMFLYLDRPCKFTVCCSNRPEITVTCKENGSNKYIGKVVSEWAFCDMIFTVYGADNQLLFNIYGNCCQWGLYLNCPCNDCAKIIFLIKNAKGEAVGEINKLYSGALKEMLTDTDNFCCEFPQGASPEEKALLLALVLFIDFRYFEQAPAQNNGIV